MSFNLKFDTTPNSSKPALCDHCRWASILRGANGEKYVYCRSIASNTGEALIQIHVTNCTQYTHIAGQTLREMKDAAWLLGTKKIVGLAGGASEEVQVSWSKPDDRKNPNVPEVSF